MEELKDIINRLYNFKATYIEKNDESTDGNVYNIVANNNEKYIAKIYKDFYQVQNMCMLYEALRANNIATPQIIKDKDNNSYFKTKGGYGIIYSYIEGIQISKLINNAARIDEDIVKKIAVSVRKMHDNVCDNLEILPRVEFADKQNRKSVIHFDLTKQNILLSGERIFIIDFDDAKYGDCICDVAILISLLFVSKKTGIDEKNMKIFLNEYYKNDEANRQKEIPLLKEYICNWVDFLLNNNDFDTSLKESFEYKKDVWLGKQ